MICYKFTIFLFYHSLSYRPHFIHNSLDFPPYHVEESCHHLASRTLSLALGTGVGTITMVGAIFFTPVSILVATTSSRLLATSIESSTSASSSPSTAAITALEISLIVLLAFDSKLHVFHACRHGTRESSHGRISLR